MKLVEFPKRLPENFTEQEFVDLINQVIDLKAIVNLPTAERSTLYDAAQYLVDFIMLAQEANGELRTHESQPMIKYNGPFVPNVLTRPDGEKFDRAALENFGVGEGHKYFGDE